VVAASQDAAALIASRNPNVSMDSMKSLLMQGADVVPQWAGLSGFHALVVAQVDWWTKAEVTLAKVNHFASPALTSAQIFSFFRWIRLCLGDDHHMRCKTLN